MLAGSTALSAKGGRPSLHVRGVDINTIALEVYRHNFGHPAAAKLVESLTPEELEAELWWASPPCQPFTRRGLRRGLEDPRGQTFAALLERLEELRPPYFAFENVVGFEGTEAQDALLGSLERAGYPRIRQWRRCPSELGWPVRRPRFYLIASRSERGLAEVERGQRVSGAGGPRIPLSSLLDPEGPPAESPLWVEPALAERYAGALHVVNAADAGAVTTCFTSAYGRSPVRSGSYLRTDAGRLRRFSPSEILRLLGFPPTFRLPPDLPMGNGWRLVGNSLALPAVREVLAHVPELLPVSKSRPPRLDSSSAS
ncbi:MAG: DNA cytosine methyltransferase [Holophagales bacterium]|nr:DNA cytosine methyltransferase [Holophagales bacterium]